MELFHLSSSTLTQARVIGWLRVGFCSSESVSENITRFEFLLSSSREDYALTCQLWRVHKWPTTVTAESTRDLLKLQFFLVSNHTLMAGGPTIVVDDCGGNRAGIFCAVNFLINQFTLAGVIDAYFIVKMLHLQRAKIFHSYEDLDYIYLVLEQFLADLQQDDVTEAYAAGYANLGVGIFNSTSPSANPFVLNKSTHTNRSANSFERAPHCSGGGGAGGSAGAGDLVSPSQPTTDDRDSLITAGDCHPDLAALQKLPDSHLTNTNYAKTNGTVAFQRIPSYHTAGGHINCKTDDRGVHKNAAYLATLLPPPPNHVGWIPTTTAAARRGCRFRLWSSFISEQLCVCVWVCVRVCVYFPELSSTHRALIYTVHVEDCHLKPEL
ncbi:unnamed protein product [Dibothriocephalus latus]|uniref:Tyrosine-protein phosphatase domain-containing protein n=1 Tax=Dibothriocephalus latus TaxID=60516 RepID=A0A3P7LRV7_DIBLA|nr:unnamed protein product [Dibothriocephalus latus]